MASKVKDIERSPKVAAFMRKVGKSFKIIAADVIEKENLIPNTRKQFKVYNDYFNEMKIKRNEKRDLIQSSRQLNRTRVYDSSNKFMEKAWSELRSNPIYEQEREEYFEDEEEKEITTSDLNESIQNSGKATSTMIGHVGEYIISNMRVSNNLQKNANLKLLNSVSSGFKITTNYLDKIESNTSQLNTHMSNSMTFYQNMLNLQKQSVEIQMAMYENQNILNTKNDYQPNTDFDRVYGKGYFDFGEYFKIVGANMSTMLSTNSMTGGFKHKFIDPIMSTDLAKLKTNPIETILSLTTRLAVRNLGAVESLSTRISEGIDNFFPNLLSRIANLSSSDNPIIKKIMSNPMASKILAILGLKVEEKKTIDTSKYDKGPVPFDGATRRSIVKVIPEYLASIEAALTGKEERYMDVASGKWITKTKVKERNKELLDTGYRTGTKDLREQMEASLQSIFGEGATIDQKYKDAIEKFLRQKYNTGRISVAAGGTDRKALYDIARQEYGMTASEAMKLVKALDSEGVQNKARSFAFTVNRARNEQNKRLANIESIGYDNLIQEFDGSNELARGGRVRGRRGEPTLAIMTAGEKVVNTFGPRETAENIAKESAYARQLGLTDVPQFAEGTGANPIRSAKNFATKAFSTVKEKTSEFIDTLKSDDMADLVLELAPNADKQKVQTILNKSATAIPRGLKGAGIGGLIGFFTGMPLIGMAVGSGIGIASVSDTVKNLLFGKDESINPETGEVTPGKKGIIPKSWVNSAKKALPNAKAGGIIGGVAGLLTGGIGILPAAIIGAGVGTVLSSNTVKEFLFGKTNADGTFEDSGLIKKKVQDYVKQKAPSMALGAVSGMVSTLLGVGPFGLLGNAVLGAGTSLLVTSDKFKDFMLGKEDENGKRSGGLLGDLKLRVLDPLVNAGKELLDEAKKFFKVNVFDNIKKFLGTAGGLITNTIADFRYMLANMMSNGSVPIDETLGSYTREAINFGKKVLTAPVRLAAGIATLPFRALGGISNKITDRMISRGNASNMTAQERLNYRRTRKGKLARYSDRYAEADKTLANASLEDLRKLYVISDLGGPNIEGFTSTAADIIHRFTDFLLKNSEQLPIKEKSIRTLQKDLARGDSDGFSKHLNSLKELNSTQKARIYDYIDNDLVVLQELKDKQGDLRVSQFRSMDYIKKTFGIKGKFGRLQLGRFNRGLSKEISAREAAEKAEEDKTNIIDPEGNKYENAFRNVVSEKLDKLISLLSDEVENTDQIKKDAQKTVEEEQTVAGRAGLTRDENGNLSVRENANATASRNRFNIRNKITKFREDLRDRRNTMRNQIKLGLSYGFGVSRNLLKDKNIDLANMDPKLIRTLRKLNLKISSKKVNTLKHVINSKYRDQLLELIDIIKLKGMHELQPADIFRLEEAIEKYTAKNEYGLLREFITLVFKKGRYRLSSYKDLYDILNEADISDDGLGYLDRNLKNFKFRGEYDNAQAVVDFTKRDLDLSEGNRLGATIRYAPKKIGKLIKSTGKKLAMTKAGQAVMKFGQQALYGREDKKDEVTGIFDFVKNYGIVGGFKALFTGDENSKNKFLKNGGLFGAVKSGAKNVVGFFFGKDKDGKTIFERHGLLGYIPAAIFGDERSPGLLGNTLLGKGVKIFGKILKGLLIAAVAAPIVGQAVHFFKATLKPLWATVLQPWWNEHITQPLKEKWEVLKKSLFGEKKVKDEDGNTYYEGGLLSGPLNALHGPITKIKNFFDGVKTKWNEAEEKSGSKTIGGVLKYFLVKDGKLVTRGSDGLYESNGSIVGNALKFILNGYKYVAKDIVTPITGFFKDKVLPWIENTAAPWFSGLLQTVVHNILYKNDQLDFNKDRLIALGNGGNKGKLSTGGWQYDSSSDSYVNVNTGAVTRDINETTGLDGIEDSLTTARNGSKSIKLEVTNGFGGTTMATISNNYYDYTILPVDKYKDKNCNNIYLITLKLKSNLDPLQIIAGGVGIGGDIGIALGGKYICYKSTSNTYKYAEPLYERNKAARIGNQSINDYGLETDEVYNNKHIYLCASNGKRYIEKGNKLVDATDVIAMASESGTTITDSDSSHYSGSFANDGDHIGSGTGFGRNHIYQNDPKIRNTRFGRSTIGDAGCGPVAAANLMGGALGYATDYAQKGGFVNNDGSTSINYFTSMFNGKNTTSKEEVKDRLKSNKPVVLLGKDESDGVYGSNNHFVTAKGYDKSGNIVVEDPDLPQPSKRYPASKVFKGMKAASIIGGKRRQDNRLVNFKDTDDNTPIGNIGSKSNLPSTQTSSYDSGNYNYSNEDYTSTDTGSSETTNTISSIFTKLGNLASLIFKKTFGITWDDITGSIGTDTGGSTTVGSGSSLLNDSIVREAVAKGSQRDRIVQIAISQIGYKEGNNNNTKYGKWYGSNNVSWCVMFVSWCADQAGIPKDIVPKMASTTAMMDWYNSKKRFFTRETYIPQPGDIIFFTKDGSKGGLNHTGLVVGLAGATLYTVEGNYSDSVVKREYINYLTNSKIYGFASPNYKDDNKQVSFAVDDGSSGSGNEGSVSVSPDKETIWKFLRNKAGLSSIGASGLFGAWEAESGLRPKRVEYDYSKKFPGYDAMNNHDTMNNFTKNVLFKQYDSQGLRYNANAYYGSDGNLYPGLGLAQWTGPRGQSLYEYTKKNGYNSIFDTDAQLNYAKSEFDKSYPNLIGKLNNAATPEDAAKVALDGYEMYSGFADKRPDILAPRAKNARAYYEQYKGLGRDDREEIYNNPIAYGPEKVVTAQTRDEGSYVSYDEYLETIVKILLTISDNTNAVNTILDIMNKEGANLSAKAREDISNAVKSSSSIQNLKDSLKNSMSGRSTGISSMIGNSRTDLIIKTMKEIASQ